MLDAGLITALSTPEGLCPQGFGQKAHTINRLCRRGLPVPEGYAISAEAVARIAASGFPDSLDLGRIVEHGKLVAIRPSPVSRSWGGPRTLVNIGMTREVAQTLAPSMGALPAARAFCHFVQEYAVSIKCQDAEAFRAQAGDLAATTARPERLIEASLEAYRSLTGEDFPEDPAEQLKDGLNSMIAAWNGASARILRSARGAPPDAGLGLIIQNMVPHLGSVREGSVQFMSPLTGEGGLFGQILPNGSPDAGQPADGGSLDRIEAQLTSELDVPSQEIRDRLKACGAEARAEFRDEMRLGFLLDGDSVMLLDAVPAERSTRAGLAAVVGLVSDGLISREEALLSIDPLNLNDVMLAQIDPRAHPEVIATGVAASPGAATGRIVFSAMAAQAMKSREQECVLVRVETSPEDVRGMYSASAILTGKGGMTSHAAVVARGLGVPCVTGATAIHVDASKRTVTIPDGRVFREGDVITVDGTGGRVLAGAPGLLEPDLGGDLGVFMSWADEVRTLGVRANSDTALEARLARQIGVDGIGLVRTEHMVFEPGRLTLMRELILAPTETDRQLALDRLLPRQRADFVEIFRIMQGLPVCIRLLDPPLHEFLPTSRGAIERLAEAMAMPVERVSERIEDLAEFNPMLGLRGVRLGMTVPEVYDMQARAIFEAAALVSREDGTSIAPEIMVPLVSTTKEVEIVKARVDEVAAAVRAENDCHFDYALGVMVETPRAAFRAREISRVAEFFSFGTNDLTQMIFGLSRDDAGRFMRDYVRQGIYDEDPFQTLDFEGVGEMLHMASERGRDARPTLVLGLCGEHGGDPRSIEFCCRAGFDYVSCSPYRAPVARLAAAQVALRDLQEGQGGASKPD